MPTAPNSARATDPLTGQIRRTAGLMQAYVLRELAYTLASNIGQQPKTNDEDQLRARAQSVSSLIRAWAEADERARIARGAPLPGSLRPEAKRVARKQATAAPVVYPGPSDASAPAVVNDIKPAS